MNATLVVVVSNLLFYIKYAPGAASSHIINFGYLPQLTSNFVNGLGQPLDIASSDTGDTDSAVLGGIHAVLLGKSVHLLRLESGVGEHTNLASDVAPVVLAAELLEVLLQQGAHSDDAVRHALDLAEPLLVQCRVVQDGAGDTGTVDRWVGVERTDKNLDLRVDALLFLGIGADDRESTNTLAVETLLESVTHSEYHISLALTMFLAKDWQRHIWWPCSTK